MSSQPKGLHKHSLKTGYFNDLNDKNTKFLSTPASPIKNTYYKNKINIWLHPPLR